MAKARHAAPGELRRGRTLVVLVVLAMLGALLVFPGAAVAVPAKTGICHFNADADPGVPPFELLGVSARAVDRCV